MGLARKCEAQISLQPQTVGDTLGFEQVRVGEPNRRALRFGEAVEKITEGACLRPSDQGIRVVVHFDERPKIAAILGEACFAQQPIEFVIADAENRVGLWVAVAETGLLDGFAQQGPGFVRFCAPDGLIRAPDTTSGFHAAPKCLYTPATKTITRRETV